MKNILRDSLGRFKSLKVNLLDGQRRGEVIFRRVFLLVVLYTIVVLVGKLVTTKPDQRVEIEEVEAVETVEVVLEKVVWEDGDRVTYRSDGVVEIVPAENFESAPEQAESSEVSSELVVGKGDTVAAFISSYGGRIDGKYLALLRKNCSEEAVKIVVAISVAESSMGKNTDKQSNFYGWFKGGNRQYDPSVEEMTAEICRGVQANYMELGTNRQVTARYTGSDRVDSWTRNFNWALSQM